MSSNKEWLQGDSLERCPKCNQQFDASYTDGWCPYFDCGEYQAPAYRSDDVESAKCPECGDEIESDYQVCPWCGESLSTEASEPSPGDLLAEGELRLDIDGQKLTLSTGETLGKNIRIVLQSQGRPDHICRKIHSEHARIIASNGTLLLRKEGRNSLTLNGRDLDQGEVRPVTGGDTIGFSGVIEAEITLI